MHSNQKPSNSDNFRVHFLATGLLDKGTVTLCCKTVWFRRHIVSQKGCCPHWVSENNPAHPLPFFSRKLSRQFSLPGSWIRDGFFGGLVRPLEIWMWILLNDQHHLAYIFPMFTRHRNNVSGLIRNSTTIYQRWFETLLGVEKWMIRDSSSLRQFEALAIESWKCCQWNITIGLVLSRYMISRCDTYRDTWVTMRYVSRYLLIALVSP